MKYNTRIESVSAEEFDIALNYCGNYIEAEPTSDSLISRNKYYWQDNRSNYHLVYKDYMTKKVVHLIFDPFTGEKDDTYEYKYRAGFKAFMALKSLAKKYDVSMPIVEHVNKVLFENMPASEAVKELMLRDKKIENIDLRQLGENTSVTDW